MNSIYCDSQVVAMPEGDAISYTMKPTKMYKASDVADLAKRVLNLTLYGPTRKEVIAELEQIVKEGA